LACTALTPCSTNIVIKPNAGNDHGGLEPALVEQWWPAGSHGVTLPDPQVQHFFWDL
jgi:hypothetical protein